MSNVNKKMAVGAVWMVLFKLVERSIGLVSTVILARVLMPADFGLVAMATSIIAVLELLGAFNFDVALIQNANAERRHYDTAWTFNVLFGLTCAALLFAISSPMAAFYNESRLQPVMCWLALTTLIGGFENIGVVAFRKNMQFDKEFRFLLAKKLIAFSVTVTLALLLRSYWALVAGMLTSRIAGVSISYLSQPYRPKLSLAARGELFHFSSWLMLTNILSFLVHRSSDFIVGKMVGPRGLGLYNLAYEISNLPTTELVAPINRAVFPGYARLASDLEALKKSFVEVAGMIAVFAVPAGVGLAAVAQPLVAVMLGDKWVDAVPMIQILAFYGVIGALQSNTGPVYMSQGKPRLLTLTSAIHVAILMPLMVWGLNSAGVLGAAWAYLASAMIHMPINLLIVAKQLKMRMREYVGAILRPLMAASLMYGMVYLLEAYLLQAEVAAWLRLLAEVLAGAVAFTCSLLAAWAVAGFPAGAEQVVGGQLKSRLGAYIRGK